MTQNEKDGVLLILKKAVYAIEQGKDEQYFNESVENIVSPFQKWFKDTEINEYKAVLKMVSALYGAINIVTGG